MHSNRKKLQHVLLVFAATLTFTVALGVGAIYLVSMKNRKEAPEPEVQQDTGVAAEIYEIDYEAEEQAAEPEPEEPVDDSRYGSILKDEEYCRDYRIYAADAAFDDEISLLFAGDISFADGYANMETLKGKGGEIAWAFDDDTMEIMRSADIFMVNNEFTYSNRGTPTEDKAFTFRGHPEYVRYLSDMGVDIVSLANNHTYDYGEVSLLDTLDTLEGADVPYVGAGRNIDEAIKPVYYIVNDVKIAFVSATQIERLDNPDTKGATADSPGTFRCWNNDRIYEVIADAAANSDYVVAYIHWGTENEVNTDWAQDRMAPKLEEAGADLIIGDHPHILQKLDYINDTPVIYSLGNYWFNSKTLDTGLLEVTLDLDGHTNTVRFIPAIQSGCRTHVVSGDESARILNAMREISPHVSIDADGYVRR